MLGKRKKYDCRFPPARIKKIMQADEEVGKVAAVVPLIISRALELFVESLLTESSKITISRNARTLTPPHLKACISSNSQFSFLKDFVATIPDIPTSIEDEHSDGNSTGPALLSSSSTTGHTTSVGSGGQQQSSMHCKLLNRSNSRTSNFSFNKSSSSTGTKGRARGRPRKSNVISRQQDSDDNNDRSGNQKSPLTQDEEEDDYETLDEDEDEDEDDDGSSCDNSTTSFSNPTAKLLPNQPISNQFTSFSLALTQQVEDDDYDN